MTPTGMPYDLNAKCSWDGYLLHIELPDAPKAIHVHHQCGSTFFGVPTGVEQELRSENAKLRELVAQLIYCAERVGNEDLFYYQPTRDGCGFDCLANGEHCSFAKICDRARELGVEVNA